MILDYIDNLGLPDDDEEIFRTELRSLLEVYQRRWDAAVPQPAAEMVGRHPVQQVVPGVAMTQCVSADAFPGTTVPISSARFTAA